MLSDLIASIVTPLSPHLRALGYLDEMLDMRRRARLNRETWQPHLDRTRDFVLSSAGRCRKRDRIIILGSGLLLDVPLADLSRMFQHVVLQDVACLPEVRKELKRYRNVSFVERDVTGLTERLLEVQREGLASLPEALPPAVPDSADLVVSLNILSQLWIVPRAYLGRRLRGIAPEQADEWCGRIVAAHYAWLRSLPCAVCLVADYEAIRRDSRGNSISRASTVYGLELPQTDASWTWDIAPVTKRNPHTSKELHVGAWLFRNGAG